MCYYDSESWVVVEEDKDLEQAYSFAARSENTIIFSIVSNRGQLKAKKEREQKVKKERAPKAKKEIEKAALIDVVPPYVKEKILAFRE